MDKLHVSDVEAAGAAGVSLKNITLHRGPDGALLDGYFLRDAEGRWTYTGGLRTGDEVAQVAGLRMSPWAGTALDEVLRRVQAEPFKLVQSGDEFYIDGLPSGPATVLRSTAEDDDAPGLVRAHLASRRCSRARSPPSPPACCARTRSTSRTRRSGGSSSGRREGQKQLCHIAWQSETSCPHGTSARSIFGEGGCRLGTFWWAMYSKCGWKHPWKTLFRSRAPRGILPGRKSTAQPG